MNEVLRPRYNNYISLSDYTFKKKPCYDEDWSATCGVPQYSTQWIVEKDGVEQDKFPGSASSDYIFEKLTESSIIKQFGSLEAFQEWRMQRENRRQEKLDKLNEDIVYNVEHDKYLRGTHSVNLKGE